MICLTDTIRELQKKGYTYSFVPQFDHFTCSDERYQIRPQDFYIDEIYRFENESDPDDQSILYALDCQKLGIKGLYVESYGLYHDELSAQMLERIKYCRNHEKNKLYHQGARSTGHSEMNADHI